MSDVAQYAVRDGQIAPAEHHGRGPLLPADPAERERGEAILEYTTSRVPREIHERLSRTVIDAVRTPEIKQRLEQMGLEPTGHAAADMARIARADYERWGPIIRAAGFEHSQ